MYTKTDKKNLSIIISLHIVCAEFFSRKNPDMYIPLITTYIYTITCLNNAYKSTPIVMRMIGCLRQIANEKGRSPIYTLYIEYTY